MSNNFYLSIYMGIGRKKNFLKQNVNYLTFNINNIAFDIK